MADKLRDKLGLYFIWPSSSSSSSTVAAAASNNQTNTDNTWNAYDSTDRGTCIDWCMSRCSITNQAAASQQLSNNDDNGLTTTTTTTSSRLTVYESWFSDHKPLWLEILFKD